MRLRYSLLIATFLTFASPALADDYVMMKVNDQDIAASEVQHLWTGLFPEGQAPAFDTVKPDVRDRILRAVMAEKILYGEALKQGIDKSPKLLSDLEELKKKLIVRSYLDSKTADLISDADLKKEYESMIGSMKEEKQVHARHILLATEGEAKEAKKKIDAGKKFEEVAREYSKDPSSAINGGDLGFFTREKMVKEFADAAFSMKKGEVSAPVKSSFGYHIIKVEEIGKVPVPTFAEVKEQLRGKLQEKKLNDFIGGLVKTAEVKLFDAKGKELPFERDLPAASTKPEAAPATKASKAAPEVKPSAAKSSSAATASKPSAEVKPVSKPVAQSRSQQRAEKSAKNASSSGNKPAEKAAAEKVSVKVSAEEALVESPVLPVTLDKVEPAAGGASYR